MNWGGGGLANSVHNMCMCPKKAGCVWAVRECKMLTTKHAGQGWTLSGHRHELSEWTWRTLKEFKIIVPGPWPTGSTLTSSSAETRLHSLENFLERMSPSFPAFLCPSPAPLVCYTLTWLAAGKCDIIIELFCAVYSHLDG